MRNLYLILPVLFLACQSPKENPESTQTAHPETQQVEVSSIIDLSAHHVDAFLEKEAIRFDIDLSFGGKKRLEGELTWSTDSRYGMVTTLQGDTMLVIDDRVWHNGTAEQDARVRFAAYTWSYFFLLPYKVEDDGVNLEKLEPTAHQQGMEVYEMTFDAGTGDAPDDWYILHMNSSTGLMDLAAYIVTAGQSKEEAEEDPHSIEYSIYNEVEGIPLAHEWTFWAWRKDLGNTEQLGHAQLQNMEFMPSTVLIVDSTRIPKSWREATP